MNIKDLVTLWRLSRRRRISEEEYQRFQRFQSLLLSQRLEGFGIELQTKLVLDLGSGVGGYSIEMARRGARVISLDLVTPSHIPAQGQTPLVASALSIPLLDETVDLVFCASLIEHVAYPAALLGEIERVLKKGGHCYLSFPPFYSPVGGHEFSPFHYLGERWAFRLAPRRRRLPPWVADVYEVTSTPESFSDTYRGWGLYKMTIANAKRLIANTGLRTLDLSTRYMPASLIRWPFLGEILTWHAQFLLEKPQR